MDIEFIYGDEEVPFIDDDSNETEKFNIVKHIGFGRNNAKSRRQLCEETGLSDRLIRRLIHDERVSGLAIINVGNGYYIPDMSCREDIEELSQYIMLMRARYVDIGDSIDSLTTWLVYSLA